MFALLLHRTLWNSSMLWPFCSFPGGVSTKRENSEVSTKRENGEQAGRLERQPSLYTTASALPTLPCVLCTCSCALRSETCARYTILPISGGGELHSGQRAKMNPACAHFSACYFMNTLSLRICFCSWVWTLNQMPTQEEMPTHAEMATPETMATQYDDAEQRLNPERPSQSTIPKPLRWCQLPYTLWWTLCRHSSIRLPHFLALSQKLGRSPLSRLSHHTAHHFWANSFTQRNPGTFLTKPTLLVPPAQDTEVVLISMLETMATKDDAATQRSNPTRPSQYESGDDISSSKNPRACLSSQ